MGAIAFVLGVVFGGAANTFDIDQFDDQFEQRINFGGSLTWMGAGIIGAELDLIGGGTITNAGTADEVAIRNLSLCVERAHLAVQRFESACHHGERPFAVEVAVGCIGVGVGDFQRAGRVAFRRGRVGYGLSGLLGGIGMAAAEAAGGVKARVDARDGGAQRIAEAGGASPQWNGFAPASLHVPEVTAARVIELPCSDGMGGGAEFGQHPQAPPGFGDIGVAFVPGIAGEIPREAEQAVGLQPVDREFGRHAEGHVLERLRHGLRYLVAVPGVHSHLVTDAVHLRHVGVSPQRRVEVSAAFCALALIVGRGGAPCKEA